MEPYSLKIGDITYSPNLPHTQLSINLIEQKGLGVGLNSTNKLTSLRSVSLGFI
jgi:hypothetical protein